MGRLTPMRCGKKTLPLNPVGLSKACQHYVKHVCMLPPASRHCCPLLCNIKAFWLPAFLLRQMHGAFCTCVWPQNLRSLEHCYTSHNSNAFYCAVSHQQQGHEHVPRWRLNCKRESELQVLQTKLAALNKSMLESVSLGKTPSMLHNSAFMSAHCHH